MNYLHTDTTNMDKSQKHCKKATRKKKRTHTTQLKCRDCQTA